MTSPGSSRVSIIFDFETHLIAPGRLAPKPVVLAYQDGDKPVRLLPCAGPRVDGTAGPEMREWVKSRRSFLVGFNVAFDLAVAAQAWPALLPYIFKAYQEGRVIDVMINEILECIATGTLKFDPVTRKRPSFSLADTSERRLGVVRDDKGEDSWRLRYAELDGIPIKAWPPEAKEYPKRDVTTTRDLYYRQITQGLPATHAHQARAAWALHLMSMRGLRADGAAVDRLEHDLLERLQDAERQLVPVGLMEPGGKENQKAIRARVNEVYVRQGQSAPRTEPSSRFPDGQVKISADVLRQSGDAMLQLLADISEDQTEMGTWIPVLRQAVEAPINPRFNVLVESGRTSASKPNVQNPPRRNGVRQCIIPRPGYVFISVDYSIAELRALAQTLYDWYGASALRDAIVAGRDPHLDFAAQLVGVSYDEAIARRKAGDTGIKEARALAKAANFGFPGGLGAASFCDFARSGYGVILSEDFAKTLKADWMRAYPEMRQYFADIAERVDEGGGRFTYTVDRTGFVRGDVGFCDGCNHAFQHLVAHGVKAALFEVAYESYVDQESPLFGFRPSIFVHDEIIGEALEGQIHEMGERLAAIMCRELGKYLPDVPVTAEPAAMRRWDKNAETVRDAAGRLQVWEAT